MSYLYGDSTPSRLESNFIQFLSDALDVSVHLLLAGERMKQCGERIAALQEGAERETRALEGLGESVKNVVAGVPKGDAASPTATCASAISEHVMELVRKQVAAVEAALVVSVATVDAEDGVERAGCVKALETLLATHDPPQSTTTFHLVNQAGKYVCKRSTRTTYGLEWVLDIDIAAPHPFSQLVRVDKFVPQLEVSAPEIGGWLRKEVRNRAQRLEKLLLTEMTFRADGATLRLRASADDDASGFDVELDEEGTIRLSRVGEQAEAIEPSEADAAKLLVLHAKLREHALAIPQANGRLADATLDESPIADLRDPAVIVDRLVAAMSPIVADIAQHSLSPTELVLKRLLGDNRREEIFVSKATLSEKLAPLPESLRRNFKPLALNGLNGLSMHSPPVQTAARVSVAPVPSTSISSAPVSAAELESVADAP
jgi:hypothetical protein